MRTLKYYLWKLKYLEGVKISKKDLDKKNIPNNIYYNQWSGNYIKIDCTNLNTNDIDIFLKVKKTNILLQGLLNGKKLQKLVY